VHNATEKSLRKTAGFSSLIGHRGRQRLITAKMITTTTIAMMTMGRMLFIFNTSIIIMQPYS
jgi:hypothetical protein